MFRSMINGELMPDDAQVIIKSGDRAVSEMSDVEREVLLIDIVQRVLDNKYYFDEIGCEIFDVLCEYGLVDTEEDTDE